SDAGSPASAGTSRSRRASPSTRRRPARSATPRSRPPASDDGPRRVQLSRCRTWARTSPTPICRSAQPCAWLPVAGRRSCWGGRRRGAWVAFGVGGVVLAATRSLGPYFVVVLVAIAVLLVGVRRAADAVRAAPRAAGVTAGCITTAIALNLWWEAVHQPSLMW